MPNRAPLRTIVAVLVLGVLAVAACADSDDDGSAEGAGDVVTDGGGEVELDGDEPGRHDGGGAGAVGTGDPAPDRPGLQLATLNVLHGLFCDRDVTDWCRAPARLEVVARHLEEAGCPELVGLQEVSLRQEELLPDLLERLCDGRYTQSWGAARSPDRGVILTTLPLLDEGWWELSHFPWEANWVRVDVDGVDVVFLTAHFASGSNDPECTPDDCAPVCPPGIRANECHALEVVERLDDVAADADLAVVAGDLNARPGSPTLAHLLEAGFVDTWLAAGNPECSPSAPQGCTSGGEEPDTPLLGMDTPEGTEFDVRIDYVLVRPGARCEPSIDAEPLAREPLATPIAGLYWPSDHAGLVATVTCR